MVGNAFMPKCLKASTIRISYIVIKGYMLYDIIKEPFVAYSMCHEPWITYVNDDMDDGSNTNHISNTK